jgi:sialate O-acetylesterase
MAVITDAGDSLDIHPRNKEVVGKRLALWALANEYGKKNLEYSGPVYKSMKIENDKIKITFDHAEGLYTLDNHLNEFTIAGDDHKFWPAQAKIEGNTVVIWNDMVTKPVAVRYSWKNVPHPELYNKSALPASPFRTDQWQGETFGKN